MYSYILHTNRFKQFSLRSSVDYTFLARKVSPLTCDDFAVLPRLFYLPLAAARCRVEPDTALAALQYCCCSCCCCRILLKLWGEIAACATIAIRRGGN